MSITIFRSVRALGRSMTILGSGLLACSTLVACSGADDWESAGETPGQSSEAVFGPREPNEHPLQPYAKEHVVAIANLNMGTCTGTQVRENVVITARHCVTTDGTINGPLGGISPILVAQRGSSTWTGPLMTGSGISRRFITNAECFASQTCNTVLGITTFFPQDIAWLYLDPSEPRFYPPTGTGESSRIVDGSVFVPVSAPTPSNVGAVSAIAGYGQFFPASPSDPENAFLHFGTLRITNASSPNTVPGGGGATVKYTSTNNRLVHSGDSGAGVWTSITNPPGIWAVHSGGEGCTFRDDRNLCSNSEGPQASWMRAELKALEEDPLPGLGAEDWEFVATGEKRDFDLIQTGNNPNWTVSSGHFTPWNNVAENMMIARTAMDNGCITTHVRTTDNDTSGIVFRYLDPSNYYWFEASGTGVMSINRKSFGTVQQLASGTWGGGFGTGGSGGTPFQVCVANRGVQAWVHSGTSSERRIVAVLPTDNFIVGGRVGLYNRWNQAARHLYLHTMSNRQGQSLVRTFLPACEGHCNVQCTSNLSPPFINGEAVQQCIRDCITNTCTD